MEYTTIGDTGLTASRICLGTLAFGSSDYHDWVLEPAESREILERAIDLGISFFDTANVYSAGESERVLGEVLGEYDRDQFVVASKTHPTRTPESYPPTDSGGGLSRKATEQDLARSLDRLGMDTIDLYQIHRWDYETPIEETLATLDDAVRRNKVRYTGATTLPAHQCAAALGAAERGGWESFATMQNHYNLVYREDERELVPLCEREGLGVLPWAPLAQGFLARPHDAFDATVRGESIDQSDWLSERNRIYRDGGGETINERVEELAAEKGVTMAQIALAWLLHQDAVDAPIVGTTSIEHLEDAVEALEIDLTRSELSYLEEPYEPGEVVGPA